MVGSSDNFIHCMNGTSNESQRTAVIKTLAIIGFIVALVFVAWLAVQAVRLAPVAFNTLASIANGLKENKESEFTIATGANVINAGEILTISWTRLRENGEYVFSYRCAEGVAVEIVDGENRSEIACDVETPLVSDKNSVAVVFSSEKSRFVDVSYGIGFTADNGTPTHERDGLITVVNPEISTNGVMADDINATSTPLATDTEPPVLPVPYTTVPVVTIAVPVSNPSGHSDLAITFSDVGTYNADTKKFTAKSSLDADERGALRFEVKNIGTKTSGIWNFIALLPTSPAFTYTSQAQAGLQPNERQVITLQFDNVSESASEQIVVAITGGSDALLVNNSFSKKIEIRD